MDAERVFHNLTIVSKLSQNDKLITEGLTFGIRPPGLLRGAQRTWWGETREHSIGSLRSLLSDAMNILTLLHCSATGAYEPYGENGRASLSTCTSDRMLQAIRDSISGMRNLLHTYIGDVSAVARLEVIIQDTEEFIRRMLVPSNDNLRELKDKNDDR